MFDPRAANHIDHHVARLIGERRKALGWSQLALAECVGVSWQQISKYETGANRVSAGRLAELARALNVTPAYFFEGAAI